MQETTIKEFIKNTLGVLPEDLKEESEVDIQHMNKKILSYNHESQSNEYKIITRIIRKKNDYKYNINLETTTLKVTIDHKFYVKFDNHYGYLKVLDIKNLIEDGKVVKIKSLYDYEEIKSIENTKEKVAIFDLEVEDNHNFYTNSVLSHNSFGNPITVSGGLAISFYSHARIWITRSEIDKETGKNIVKFNFVKNKMGLPFKIGKCIYDWHNGFDRSSEMVEIAVEAGLIKKEKTSYILPQREDVKLVGKKKLDEYIKENQDYLKEVLEPIVELYLNTREEIVDEAVAD